jgi:hypothetical protein
MTSNRQQLLTAMVHRTLNTGHENASLRADVDHAAIDRLLPIVDAEGGWIPEVMLAVDILVPLDADQRRRHGSAFFQIAPAVGMSKTPYVMAVACWDPAMADEAWEMVRQCYMPLRHALEKIGLWAPLSPTPPDGGAWLAVCLTPHITQLPDDRLSMLGDMERCIYWALVEAEE